MPTTPWIRISSPASDREYLGLISYLPLRHFRAFSNFFRFAFQIQRQLKTAPGLIGYSLDAKPFSKKFWTLSVWEDQQSLNNFVRQIPHSQVMQALAPHMDKTQFAQWTVTHTDIPPNWSAAKARLNQT
jgi:heme-degrading monooxygenase HmoA